MPRVDAHLHVWDLERRPQPWTDDLPALRRSFSLGDVRADQAAAGVSGSVLVQCVAEVDETRELLALAAVEPAVAGVVGWLDLDAEAFADDLARLRGGPGGDRLVGLRHQLQVEPDKDWLDRRPVQDALRQLGAAGLTYDVVVSSEQLDQVTRVAASLPGTRFVLDHCGNPPLRDGDLEAWRRSLVALAAHDNVAVKLSGLATHGTWGTASATGLRPVAEHVLATFGPGRTMFGSDWPVSLLGAGGYPDVVTLAEQLLAPLTALEQEAVWWRTAATWYGLRQDRPTGERDAH